MIDDYGRQILLHGVNVVYKIPPFYPNLTTFTFDDSLAPYDMAFLRDNGFNVVRLFVSWAGTEPTPGAYNYTYLQVEGKDPLLIPITTLSFPHTRSIYLCLSLFPSTRPGD